jgi:DNA-directed RNA polymerase subunit N (RpoN/RPB10)
VYCESICISAALPLHSHHHVLKCKLFSLITTSQLENSTIHLIVPVKCWNCMLPEGIYCASSDNLKVVSHSKLEQANSYFSNAFNQWPSQVPSFGMSYSLGVATVILISPCVPYIFLLVLVRDDDVLFLLLITFLRTRCLNCGYWIASSLYLFLIKLTQHTKQLCVFCRQAT